MPIDEKKILRCEIEISGNNPKNVELTPDLQAVFVSYLGDGEYEDDAVMRIANQIFALKTLPIESQTVTVVKKIQSFSALLVNYFSDPSIPIKEEPVESSKYKQKKLVETLK